MKNILIAGSLLSVFFDMRVRALEEMSMHVCSSCFNAFWSVTVGGLLYI